MIQMIVLGVMEFQIVVQLKIFVVFVEEMGLVA